MFDSLAHDGVKRPGTREMTAMLAGLMALNAFAIDSMIPALPDIGRSLHVARENDRQLVVIAYFLGFASTQLLWGPLADRFGRKPVLGIGIALYGAFALLCAFAGSFTLLIAARVAMGASAPMALASWLNSRVVGRFGLRRVGHSASAMLAIVTAAHAIIALLGFESLPMFIVVQGLTMGSFAFASSNLGTLAMEHMAHIAGTASSVQGVIGTIGAALIGFAIGQQFDGTPLPFLIGTALCASGGFLIIVLTEPKRLFAPIQADREELQTARKSTAVPEDLA
jgi:DHA1 family bicyclomycin/chloramphenicol resistance-like MFS transporter